MICESFNDEKPPISSTRSAIDFFLVLLASIGTLGSAWLVGGVHDVVFAVAGGCGWLALFLIAICNWNAPKDGFLWSSRLPLLFFMPFLLGALQLVPFPSDFVEFVSPERYEMSRQLDDGNEKDRLSVTGITTGVEDGVERSSKMTLSMAPASTRKELARYWVVLAFLLVGMFGITGSRWRRIYLNAVVFNGVAIAIFALLKKIGRDGQMVYWNWDFPWSAMGPFVNKNNGAGYLLMVLAVAMSFLADRFVEANRGRSSGSGLRSRLVMAIREMINDNAMITIFGLIMLLWMAIMISLSRGAFGGLVVATAVTIIFVWTRYRTHSLLVIGLATVLSCGLVAWSQQTDRVATRLSTIVEKGAYGTNRFSHWVDDCHMMQGYLVTGTGIGTYRHANRPYQTMQQQAWFCYSENQYLESVIVGGVVGFLLLVAFLFALGKNAIRLVARSRISPSFTGKATLAVFLVLGQMIAAFFDFALYNAANGCLFASLAGLVFGDGQSQREIVTAVIRPSKISLHRIWLVGVLLLGAACMVELVGHGCVENAMHWSAARIEIADKGPSAPASDVEREIQNLQSSLEYLPHHAFGWARLGNLYTMRFRQDLFIELSDGLGDDQIQDEMLWNLTDPLVGRSLSQTLDDGGSGVRPVFNDHSYQAHIIPAWNALLTSRDICPMIPSVHYKLAILCPLVGGTPEDTRRHLERAIFLAPRNNVLLVNAGVLMYQAGAQEQGLAWIKMAVAAQSEVSDGVALFAKNFLTPQEFVSKALPANPQLLMDVGNDYFSEPQFLAWRLALGKEASGLLQKTNPSDARNVYLLANATRMMGQLKSACSMYRSALDTVPGATPWRFEYAKTLMEAGELHKASREAELCLRQMPDSPKLKRLRREITQAMRLAGKEL